jgi:hydroxymethylbilane synthase
VAALATVEGMRIAMRAELLAEDGSAYVAGDGSGPIGDIGMAAALAGDLLERAPPPVRRLFAA